MADKTINGKSIVEVKEEQKSDDDSDSSEPLSGLDLVRAMYESIKDISSKTETKPYKGKSYMDVCKKDHSDYFGRGGMEPDRSRADFYCKICEAHMNSEEIWESHVSGKRHLKNIQKLPSEMPSKLRSIKINAKAHLLNAIKRVNEPVVGLQFMTELQRADPCLKPSYTCHLCQANCTSSVVIDHILTTKHRLAYIKAVDPDKYEVIESMGLQTLCLDELAKDQARAYEEKSGCGEIEVKLEKPKVVPPPRMEIAYKESRSRSLSSERTRRSPSHHRSRSRSPCKRRSSHRCRRSHCHKIAVPWLKKTEYISNEFCRYGKTGEKTETRYSSSSSEERTPHRHAKSPSVDIEEIKIEVIEKLSSSDKMKFLQSLAQAIHPLPRSLAEEVPQIITNLTTAILRYKIRQLPLAAQNKLAKCIAKEETRKLFRQLTPL